MVGPGHWLARRPEALSQVCRAPVFTPHLFCTGTTLAVCCLIATPPQAAPSDRPMPPPAQPLALQRCSAFRAGDASGRLLSRRRGTSLPPPAGFAAHRRQRRQTTLVVRAVFDLPLNWNHTDWLKVRLPGCMHLLRQTQSNMCRQVCSAAQHPAEAPTAAPRMLRAAPQVPRGQAQVTLYPWMAAFQRQECMRRWLQAEVGWGVGWGSPRAASILPAWFACCSLLMPSW